MDFLVDFLLPALLDPFLLMNSLDFSPLVPLMSSLAKRLELISILITISSSGIMIVSSCEPEPTYEGREGPGTP